MKNQATEKSKIAVVDATEQASTQLQQINPSAQTKNSSTGNGAEKVGKQTVPPVSPIGETPKVGAKAKLKLCEEVIRTNEGSGFEIGRNLAQINDEDLYTAAGFTSFEKYTKKQWGMSDKHAYRLIKAAKIYDVLKAHKGEKNRVLPRSESHIRPLVDRKVPEKKWVATWEKVVEKFAGKPFTAEDIDKVINPDKATDPKAAEATESARETKAIKAKLERNLAKIDKLVSKALEKATDKETIKVEAYQKLLERIKELIEGASK